VSLSSEPIEFFRHILGFEPTQYQKDLIKLFQDNQFVAARWCRQSGKSFIISALLLWYAYSNKDVSIAVVGPSWRQAKLVIRRITYFLRKLPPGSVFKPQKTAIHFTNGSAIEAYPNNPETIRGPTSDLVYCDEMSFLPNDEEMYDAILFTLGTTNGKFVCSSTPWSTDSIFWKIFNHKDFNDFARSHVTWQDAVEPNGPLKKNILEKIRKQFEEDQSRWKREMEAEWAEDEDVWLSQSLITKCIGSQKTLGFEVDLFPWESQKEGEFYAGVDFGKHNDYSVFIAIEKAGDKFLLRHLKMWPLETGYASVIGYVKSLQDRWDGFQKLRADITGVGEYIIEDMKNGGLENVEGVFFSLPRKQEMASLLKQRMAEGKYYFPYFTWEKPYRSDYVTELNVERFKLRKDGTIAFSHPRGTHDDTWWATALALYSTVEMKPEPQIWVVPR
jgi:phage FluMu gp28-like protein